MKKIIACISLVFAMSAGVTALAADATYVKDGNKVTNFNATNYSTVLITENAIDDVDDIVYVNQNDSGLGSSVDFLLKDGAKDGDYIIKLGGASDGSTATASFRISSIVKVENEMEITNLKNNGATYDIGCFAEGLTASECSFIAVTVTKGGDSKTGFYQSPFVTSGEGMINAAVKITNIPTGYDVAVALTNVEE